MNRLTKWWVLGWTWKAGRVRVDVSPSSFNRPLFVHQNDGPDWHYFAFGWGNGNSDPAIMVEVTLGNRDE